MTSQLIEFFKSYSKFNKETKNYYINNLKTVFNFNNRSYEDNDDLYYEMVNDEIESYKKHLKQTHDKWICESEISELDEKHEINESTVSKVINIFYYLNSYNFNFDELYKSKFSQYILYVLEKKRTKESHEANRFIKYKNLKEWFDSYDMNFMIIKKFMSSNIERLENRINEIIDTKIKINLSNLFNNNTDLLKDLIRNLNEESKNVLIDEIIKYNENEIVERVSKKLNVNKVVDKLSMKVLKESNEEINKQFKYKLDEFVKSDSTTERIKTTINEVIGYGRYIKDMVENEEGTFNYKITRRLNEITKSINNLKVHACARQEQYSNVSTSSTTESNESSEIETSESEEDNDDSKINYDNCFVLHGKNQFNLKLKELMKCSKYDNFNDFKTDLIEKNIIKKDFKLAGSTYRLTKEQKETFINEFVRFTGMVRSTSSASAKSSQK